MNHPGLQAGFTLKMGGSQTTLYKAIVKAGEDVNRKGRTTCQQRN